MPDAIGKSPFAYKTFILFCLVAVTTLIGTPLFGYVYGYTLFDWVLFSILYIVTGLGITVGYHRLISHRSFECHPWVKAFLLMAGGWALQNSALRWCSDHIRHHARTDQEEDPYNAKKGFWHSHCVWLFINTPHRTENYERQLAERPDDHVAAPPLSRHRHLGARVSLRPGVFPRRCDGRHRVFSARRHVPDVHGPELHVRDQFPLSHVRHATAWPARQQPRQLAHLLLHVWRGLPQLSPYLRPGLPQRPALVQCSILPSGRSTRCPCWDWPPTYAGWTPPSCLSRTTRPSDPARVNGPIFFPLVHRL